MRYLFTLIFSLILSCSYTQSGSISGMLTDVSGEPVIYANVVLYDQTDDRLVKVETTDLEGFQVYQNLRTS